MVVPPLLCDSKYSLITLCIHYYIYESIYIFLHVPQIHCCYECNLHLIIVSVVDNILAWGFFSLIVDLLQREARITTLVAAAGSINR